MHDQTATCANILVVVPYNGITLINSRGLGVLIFSHKHLKSCSCGKHSILSSFYEGRLKSSWPHYEGVATDQ